ncbi:MAG: arsenate reductase ArsC [archaeon]|nr:arsenate reductase ArsC [archaeon]
MKNSIIFACIGNSCRSQMAEGLAKNLANNQIEISSAGTKPSKEINPLTIQVMKEIGINISNQKPKMITAELLKDANNFISMGSGVKESCRFFLFHNNIEDWDLEDPDGKDIEFFRKTRDIIKNKVEDLLVRLKT